MPFMEFTDEMLSCTVADDIMLNCYQNKQQKFHFTRFPSVFVKFKFIVVWRRLGLSVRYLEKDSYLIFVVRSLISVLIYFENSLHSSTV